MAGDGGRWLSAYRWTCVLLGLAALGVVAAVVGFTVNGVLGDRATRAELPSYQAVSADVRPVAITGTAKGGAYDLYTTSSDHKPCASAEADMQNLQTVLADDTHPVITLDGRRFLLVGQLETDASIQHDAGLGLNGDGDAIRVSCSSGVDFTVADTELQHAISARRTPMTVLAVFGIAGALIFGIAGWRVGLRERENAVRSRPIGE